MLEQNHPEKSQDPERDAVFKQIVDAIRRGLTITIDACREIAANPEDVQAWLLANQLPATMLDRIARIARYDSSKLSSAQQVEVLEMNIALADFFKRNK